MFTYLFFAIGVLMCPSPRNVCESRSGPAGARAPAASAPLRDATRAGELALLKLDGWQRQFLYLLAPPATADAARAGHVAAEQGAEQSNEEATMLPPLRAVGCHWQVPHLSDPSHGTRWLGFWIKLDLCSRFVPGSLAAVSPHVSQCRQAPRRKKVAPLCVKRPFAAWSGLS